MGDGENEKHDGQPVEEEPEGILRVFRHEPAGVTPGHEGKDNYHYAAGILDYPQRVKGEGDHEALLSDPRLKRLRLR